MPALRPLRCLALALALTLVGVPRQTAAQTSRLEADRWITNAVLYPAGLPDKPAPFPAFAPLRAEILAGQLRVFLPTDALRDTNATPTLFASADEPGHWPARDWRRWPMTRRGPAWEATVPVDDVDVPLVYFVHLSTIAIATTNSPPALPPPSPLVGRGERDGVRGDRSDSGPPNMRPTAAGISSPMRVCFPRAAGMEIPSRIFWPFLDGCEDGLDGWRLLAPTNTPALRADADARSGHAALAVTLPEGQRSVTVATVRVRGWHLQQQAATGVRLWLRAPAGDGKARFTLLAHALTPNQVVAVCPIEPKLTAQWQRVDLPFSAFPRLPWHDVDLLTIEFLGTGPRVFLVDDLQLLGRWKVPGQ